jgi:hypothetical protein
MRRLPIAIIMAVALSLVVGAALLGCEASTQTPASDDSKAQAHESELSNEHAKIRSAMSAAPTSVAKDATIVDYPKKATEPLLKLRKGTNGWTCFPDWQATPGNDPMCLDKMWMQWFEAISSATDPNIDQPGIAYMLQGGSDASNTDPFAMKPKVGEHWVSAPPHVMLIVPGKLDTTLLSTDHHSAEPWVMYAGTPYEHVMIPVEEEVN